MTQEWRCQDCKKLLGTVEGKRLRIRYARRHEYLVGLPADGTCSRCGALNELPRIRYRNERPSVVTTS